MSLADRLGRCLGRWLGTGIEQRLAARHLADAARATGAVARAARGPATRGADNKVGRPRGSESEHLPVSLADLGIAAPRLHEARIIRDTYTDDDRGASPR
ncbi:MAG: hypothetical protein M5T61_18910 [Acidimicrobiia bacterium]|nr:hypothetical protein [Acidimicrobiia bacterium]